MALRALAFRNVLSRGPVRVAIIIALACIVLIVCADLAVSGRKGYVAAAAAIALLPLLGFAALQRPILFPFAFWALLVPFDNLLQVGKSGTVTRFVAILCVAVLVFYILRTRRIVTPPNTIFLWLGYAVWSGASALWAIDPANSAVVFGRIGLAVALYLTICAVPVDRQDLKIIIGAVAIGGVAAAIYGIHLFHASGVAHQEAQRELGRLEIVVGDNGIDINHFADSLLFPALVLIVGTLRPGPLLMRCVSGAGLLTVLIALKYSASREAYLALGCGMVYLYVALPTYRRMIGFVGVVSIGLTLSQPAVWERFMVAGRTGGSGRTSIWHTGLAAVPQHWLAGVGLGNFSRAYDTTYLTIFQRYNAGWDRASHDIFLQALVELGVVGLVLLGAALVGQFFTLPRKSEDPTRQELYAVLHAAFVSLVAASIFIDLVDYRYFWLLLCVMAIARNVPSLRNPNALRSSG